MRSVFESNALLPPAKCTVWHALYAVIIEVPVLLDNYVNSHPYGSLVVEKFYFTFARNVL
jgi:hypothetical protein